MKKKLKVSLIILILLGLGALAFLRSFPSLVNPHEPDIQTYSIHMDENLFYRQSLNNCGPYSVMAVTSILRNDEAAPDPEVLAKQMKWRIRKNMTFPQGVISLLHDNKIKTKEYVLYTKSDSQKISFLKEQILHDTPIILLIRQHGILHYVTVLGFDDNGFMLYDSMQEKSADDPGHTIRDEKAIEGNRYFTNQELLDQWNSGGVKFAFRNWCVVCKKK